MNLRHVISFLALEMWISNKEQTQCKFVFVIFFYSFLKLLVMIVVDIVLSHSQKYCIHMKTEMSPLLVKGCNIGFSSVVMAFMKGGHVIVLHLCSVECPPMEN